MLGISEDFLDKSNIKYYNRSEEHSQRDMKGLIFLSEKSLQSAELNEIQQYSFKNQKQISDKLYKSGDLISGGVLVLKNNKTNIDATLSEAEVYFEGYVVTIPSQDIVLDKNGSQNIGVGVTYKVIYENQYKADPSKDELTEVDMIDIKNPATGAANYQQYGAGRIDISGEWAQEGTFVEDEENYKFYVNLYEIQDGVLIKSDKPALKTSTIIADVIAEYDAATNGNYVTSGLEIHYDKTVDDIHKLLLTPGGARVDGRKIEFNTDSFIDLPVNTDTAQIVDETQDPLTGPEFNLNYKDILDLENIDYAVHQIKDYVATGDEVELDEINIIEIISIEIGDSNIDPSKYSLVNDVVVFSDSSDFSNGDTLSIDYLWKKTVTGADLEEVTTLDQKLGVVTTSITDIWMGDTSELVPYIDFTYNFALTRKDLIVLEANGSISIVKGISKIKNIVTPSQNYGFVLAVATNKTLNMPKIELMYVKNYKISEMQGLFDRVENLEYNLSRVALIDAAQQKDAYRPKKNIFIDSFNKKLFRDLGAEQTLGESAQMHNGELESGFELGRHTKFNKSFNDEITLDRVGDYLAMSQDWDTGTRIVNEFEWVTDISVAPLTISPAVYSFISRQTTSSRTVYNSRTRSNTVVNPWRGWWGYGSTRTSSSTSSSSSNSLSSSISQTPSPEKTNATFNVSLKSSGFNGGEVVELYFEKDIDGEPTDTITADSVGDINQQWVVPVGTFAGQKKITLYGRESLNRSESEMTIISNLKNTLTTTTVTRTTTYTTTVTRSWWWWWRRRDPLAQTFLPDSDLSVSKIEIKFDMDSLPDNPKAVACAIMGVKVGIPDNTDILGLAAINSDMIKDNASEEGVYGFDFNGIDLKGDQEYAIVILADDPHIKIHTSKLNERDFIKQKKLVRQPHNGVLLQSANTRTWESFPTEDMWFKIYAGKYAVTKELDMISINVDGVTEFILDCETECPEKTSIKFFAHMIETGDILPVDVGIRNEFKEYTGEIVFRALLETDNEYVTPKLMPDINVFVDRMALKSHYVSKAIEINGANDLKLYVEVDKVQKMEYIDLYFRIISNGEFSEWKEFPIQKTETNIEFNTIEWENVIENAFTSDEQQIGDIQVRIDINECPDDKSFVVNAKNLRVILS